MVIYLMTRSACSYGCNCTFSLVGDYLEHGLGDYGTAIKQLDITACFRGGRIGHPSLQSSYDAFHATFLPSLPKLKFLRKRNRFDVEYGTKVADASFLDRYGFLSPDVFLAALKEVAQALHLMDTRLKKGDEFDLQRFHDDVGRLVDAAPTTEEALRSLEAKAKQESEARLAAMDPWEKFDIDWSTYHPQARSLLDQPFFWSSSDGYAPHGSDTGADLLSDFVKWNRPHPDRPAYKMALALLAAWDIPKIDLEAADETVVAELIREDPFAISETDDALVAVAFAAIKLRGSCDPQTRRLALLAIARERMAAVITERGWQDSAERLRTLGILEDVLLKIA